MGFLAVLPSEYDSAKAQILSSLEASLQETFSRILRTEVSSSSSPTLVSALRYLSVPVLFEMFVLRYLNLIISL